MSAAIKEEVKAAAAARQPLPKRMVKALGGVFVPILPAIHHMYNVIEAGTLSSVDGLNIWLPIASAANFAQGAACLAVWPAEPLARY